VKRRSLPFTAALTATEALQLTACGSGDDKSGDDDKIAGGQGAETPKESASASRAPAGATPDGVDVSLPKDMNLVFDWDRPKNKDEAAAMQDAANFVRPPTEASTSTRPRTPPWSPTRQAMGRATRRHRSTPGWTAHGTRHTAHGTRHHYHATTR
jgi:hypothetical protein